MKKLLFLTVFAAAAQIPVSGLADTATARPVQLIKAEIDTLDPYMPGFDAKLDRLLAEEAAAQARAGTVLAAN